MTIRSDGRGGRRRGFTLVELLLVIMILAILAALAAPLFGRYADQAAETAAVANLDAAQKAVVLYKTKNGVWPEELTSDMFRMGAVPEMPDGWELVYDSETGVVALVEPEE